jgi:hypothetical protein
MSTQTPPQTLIGQFNKFLEPNNIALRSQTSSVHAHTIVEVLKKRVGACARLTKSDQDRLQQYIDNFCTVIHTADPVELAVDHGLKVPDVQRITSVVGVGIAIFLEAYDAAQNRSINIWSILGYSPIATTETTVWPPQVTQHASAVRDAVITVHDKRIPLNPSLVAVPLKDLENLCHGASLLSQNLATVYRKFQVAADAAHNDQGATNLLPEL